jgi:RNA polymerase-binding transcription factor DksA
MRLTSMSEPAAPFNDIRQRLRSRRDVLRARVTAVEADRRRTGGPLSPDFAEQSVERENDEVLDSLLTTDTAELQRVERALQRLRAGTYGVCVMCHERIEPERLDTVPEAERCARCATER